jgi:hypothetical protein
MQTIEYKTGRTYNGAQVLQITVEHEALDDFNMRDFVATFADASRGITGRVKATVYASDSLAYAVLAEYDAGRYTAI